MSDLKPFNLFVYGTLMNPSVFRAVLGLRLVTRLAEADNVKIFHARRAILNGYKKVSPDNTYLYAMPDRQGRIRGYLVNGLPGRCMAALRNYEGRNYRQRRLQVETSTGTEKAVAFLCNIPQMEHSFGYQFRDNFKQEILLERKIDAALLEAERDELHTTEGASRRAIAELRGNTIRDLRRRHFEAGGISDYAIRRSLSDSPLPDFARIRDDAEAEALSANYLSLVTRQVLFNEMEEHIRRDFRYELDRLDLRHVYYDRTISSLAALRMLNSRSDLIGILVGDCLTELSFRRDRLVDYVRWGVKAADSIYDRFWAKQEMDFLRNHMGKGNIPLGAELEFSNIGHAVIRDPHGEAIRDLRYDGFLYFTDFALDALTWKLGGHLDDHHEKFSEAPRRGFFEVALGNLSLEANLSKPITDDPWTLNQFIQETRQFYDITPHSVHVSLQIQGRRPARDRLLPLGAMKCLFALAGDLGPDDSGNLIIRRLLSDEIVGREPRPHMLFSQVSRRRSSDPDSSQSYVRSGRAMGRYVQQFKFLRLTPDLNYEPIIMALKGLQLHLSPGSYLDGTQSARSAKHRELFEALLEWAAHPTGLSEPEIEEFLSPVYEGLMAEKRDRPAHSGAYIAWAISHLRESLRAFNEVLAPGTASQSVPKDAAPATRTSRKR
jgi:gamma-glutamylcyclotransferase (GGCT)/AIG2-like uncharacterized protein YtfP